MNMKKMRQKYRRFNRLIGQILPIVLLKRPT